MDKNNKYPSKSTQELFRAVLSLKNQKEATDFFRDLLTLPELEDFSQRFQIAKLLFKGNSYALTAKRVQASTTTVSRVAHWLFRGRGGYLTVLRRLFPETKR